jgi:hypothetical protein
MKFTLLGLICVPLMTGCHHSVTEQDLVGTWTRDPAAPSTTGHPEVEAKLVVTLTADHKFTLATPTPAGFEGTWAFDKGTKKVGLSPVTLVIANPADPAKKNRLPIAQALQMMQSRSANPKMVDALQKASVEEFLVPSEDGKKLSENGKPAFVKSGS